MDEYINRQEIFDTVDLLMTRFPYKVPGRSDTFSQYNEAWNDACSYALDAIRNNPPANVRPVVRGRWVWNKDNGYYYCSECRAVSPRKDQDGEYCDCPNYCPICGADMRGGDAE